MPFPIALVLAFFFLCLFWAFIGSLSVVKQPRYVPGATPGDYGLAWEPLALTTEDGIPIAGWLIRHPQASGVLILLHGFGTAKADLLDMSQAFHGRMPYHLALIDFRGHGESGGRRISFGFREVLDVQAVLSFVKQDAALKELPVVCYGISMGGAIAILAAARFQQINAVVTDSAYADLGKAIAMAIWMAYHIPRFFLGQLVLWGTQVRLGCRLLSLSPVRCVGRIAPRPILVIHGTGDRTVPPDEADALFRAAGDPKELWLVPGAEHVGCFYKDQETYLRHIEGFLSHVL